MANQHKGEVKLVTEEFGELLLIFDGNAYASLEERWGCSMKGVVDRIAGWNEKTIKLGQLGDLLAALATRHHPNFTRVDAMDVIGFPSPDPLVMEKMLLAVSLSLPEAKVETAKPGEPAPPKAKRRSGTGTPR